MNNFTHYAEKSLMRRCLLCICIIWESSISYGAKAKSVEHFDSRLLEGEGVYEQVSWGELRLPRGSCGPQNSSLRSNFLMNASLMEQVDPNFVCEIMAMAEASNTEVLEDRKQLQNFLIKLKTGKPSLEERTHGLYLLMKYRLLGPRNYSFSMTEFNQKEILELTKAEAKDLAEGNPEAPQKCTYIVKSGEIYRIVTKPITSKECLQEVELRLNIIPPSLVATQAIHESNWGTSRFADQGFNYFGIQVKMKSSKDLKERRCIAAKKNSRKCVVKFENPKDAIYQYYQFLNSGTYQTEFREYRRRNYTESSNCLSGERLTSGLKNYAEDPNYEDIISDSVYGTCKVYENACKINSANLSYRQLVSY